MPSFAVAPARSADDVAAVTALFKAYTSALGLDLSYQNPDAELVAMPGKYAPPRGELLLARLADGTPAGCVGLRPIEPEGVCEMKRLYVAPKARGLGIGAVLVDAIVTVGRMRGYTELRLDTMGGMTSALALYKAAGFVPIAAYCENPFPDALFLGLRLDPV